MRPEFHFTAPGGWINDPHGITFVDGEYHVFYQHVPDSMIWGPNCQWGHATGRNLLELQHKPIALAPGDGDDGIWSGSLVVDHQCAPHIFYTATSDPDFSIGRIRTARTLHENWDCWEKGEVLATAPADLALIAYRDPFVFRDGDQWRMLVGAALQDGTAAALTYTSSDLTDWSYDGIAASRPSREIEPVWMGALWECPQLFEIEGRHVLVTSIWDDDMLHYAGYGIGTYQDGRFTAETWGRLSFGRCYYAPSFFRDAAGRPCLTFWMRGVRDGDAGWSGAHSIPFVLSLDDDRLVAVPHPDLERYMDHDVAAAQEVPTAASVRWRPENRDQLIVRAAGRQILRIDRTAADLVVYGSGDVWSMPYSGGEARLILDGPTAELITVDGVLATPISPRGNALALTSMKSVPEVRALRR